MLFDLLVIGGVMKWRAGTCAKNAVAAKESRMKPNKDRFRVSYFSYRHV